MKSTKYYFLMLLIAITKYGIAMDGEKKVMENKLEIEKTSQFPALNNLALEVAKNHQAAHSIISEKKCPLESLFLTNIKGAQKAWLRHNENNIPLHVLYNGVKMPSVASNHIIETLHNSSATIVYRKDNAPKQAMLDIGSFIDTCNLYIPRPLFKIPDCAMPPNCTMRPTVHMTKKQDGKVQFVTLDQVPQENILIALNALQIQKNENGNYNLDVTDFEQAFCVVRASRALKEHTLEDIIEQNIKEGRKREVIPAFMNYFNKSSDEEKQRVVTTFLANQETKKQVMKVYQQQQSFFQRRPKASLAIMGGISLLLGGGIVKLFEK